MNEDSAAPSHNAVFRRLVGTFNRIGLKISGELLQEDASRNTLISPCALAFALSMLYNGAGGATRQALADVLETHGISTEEINDGNAALRASLTASGGDIRVAMANALWVHGEGRFQASFVQAMKRFYAAEVAGLDFTDPASLLIINRWAQQQTGGKIDALLSRDDLSTSTDCILTSAVYFKGLWASPFPTSGTRETPFKLPSGRCHHVPMMYQTNRFAYYETTEFQALSLPYGDGRLSMYVFLPSEDSSLEKLLGKMNAETWEGWLTQFEERQLKVVLPRFKFAYEAEMRTPLTALGLGRLFESGADFGPMGMSGHYIEKFKHKAVVEVNEEGTEAAATTAVIMGRSLPASLSMIVNRPYFWTIRDNTCGALIFIGLVFDPRLSST